MLKGMVDVVKQSIGNLFRFHTTSMSLDAFFLAAVRIAISVLMRFVQRGGARGPLRRELSQDQAARPPLCIKFLQPRTSLWRSRSLPWYLRRES